MRAMTISPSGSRFNRSGAGMDAGRVREGLDMGRQGWAFFLGLLVGAAGVAQPPSDAERFPPPPDLPGEVVSHPPTNQAIATAAMKSKRQRAADPIGITPTPKGPASAAAPIVT